MKTKPLGAPGGHLLVLDPGDDVIAKLTEFAKQHDIEGASFSGIGAFAWSRLSRDAVGIESSWNLLEATPGARLTLAAAPKLGVYGEAGVGLFFGRFAYSWSFPTPGETGRNELGPSMRFGAGGLYDLNSRMRLEAGISVGRYFGDVHATTWILSVGGMVGT